MTVDNDSDAHRGHLAESARAYARNVTTPAFRETDSTTTAARRGNNRTNPQNGTPRCCPVQPHSITRSATEPKNVLSEMTG